MKKEVFKPISGYEGIYEISNYGNVKRVSDFKNCNKKYIGNYFLKPLDNGCGYFRIKLSKNGVSKRYMLHRLIAIEFLENENNYKIINHIDSNKKNNSINNLEWCTQKHNIIEFNKTNPLLGAKVKKTKGYTYDKRYGTYFCRISIDSKTIHLGTFKTKNECIEKYNKAYEDKINFLTNRFNNLKLNG